MREARLRRMLVPLGWVTEEEFGVGNYSGLFLNPIGKTSPRLKLYFVRAYIGAAIPRGGYSVFPTMDPIGGGINSEKFLPKSASDWGDVGE